MLITLNDRPHHSLPPPVGVEDPLDLLDDLSIANHHADLPPLVEFEPAKALAADERTPAISHDRADVQALIRFSHLEGTGLPLLLDRSNNLDRDTGLGAALQFLQHLIV